MTKKFDDRTLDLLCEQALYGLTEEQLRELGTLDEKALGSLDAQELELTAARLSLIGIEETAQLPEHLFSKILADSKSHIKVEQNVFTKPRTEPVSPKETSGGLFGWLGWAAAAVACIALVVTIFNTRGTTEVAGPTPPVQTNDVLTPAQLRQRLIETEQALVRAEWAKGNVPQSEGISGDVVWSDSKQEGFMRIKGLPVNDAAKEQYQLWIFEDGKLEAHPKDGGVFDVNDAGEVIIPINAKLKTIDPKAFAITVEKPGGVVVSERDKIAGLAAVKSSQT